MSLGSPLGQSVVTRGSEPVSIGGAAPEFVALGGGWATTVLGDAELAAAPPWLFADAALPVEPAGEPLGEVVH